MFGLFKGKQQKERERILAQQKQADEERLYQLSKQKEKEHKDLLKNNYEKTRREYGYTKSHNGVITLNKKKYYAFLSEQHFKLFICQPQNWNVTNIKNIPNWDRRAIHLSNIHYFYRDGEVYTETKVSGGGNTGPNIGGAIVGGIIAGPAGAIIGGQNKRQPIKSETIRHDERKTVLVYNKGKLEFAPEDYAVLMKLIPDKELSVVQQKRALESHQSKQPSVEDKLRKLKALHDDELLTDEEFEEKRKKLVEEL